MEDKLRLNTKLYGFDGIIGRRDYFLNYIIIMSIGLLFMLPYETWIFCHIQTFADVLNLQKMFSQVPILLKIWTIMGILCTFVLLSSNICRRLNDINGKINHFINGTVISVFLLSSFGLMLPLAFSCLIGTIRTILLLITLFQRGKITGNYPYDFTKEFNWGAFIGTWIWGLFNKSYKTLWIFLIGFTPWGFYYQIYCGLKGNEWAFKNKKCNDVELFNKSQRKQSTIFSVIFFAGIPLIYFILMVCTVLSIMFVTVDNAKNNPQKAEQTMTKLENTLYNFGSIYFESHLITPEENKYYVKSSDWEGYSFKEKKNILDMAANFAATERKREYQKQHPDSYKSFSKFEELPRTKIYSSETNHLLGEYFVDEASLNSNSFRETLKAAMNAYKFYNDKN